LKNKKLFISIFIVVLLVSTSFYGYNFVKDNYIAKLKIFNQILNKINTSYVEEKDIGSLIDTAIDGVLKELDPHSVYLKPERGERMRDEYQGYAGIGITFIVKDSMATAMQVHKDGPAYEAGMEPGDKIIKIEDENAVGMDAEEIKKRLKGHPNTPVTIYVDRAGVSNLIELTIHRRRLFPESVVADLLFENGIGYIKIEKFTMSTFHEFMNSTQILKKQGMNKLIIDLRDNGGGFLKAAFDIASEFLPEGKMIVYTKGRASGSDREYRVRNKPLYPDMPLIIMINDNSASGSEILAGAIQDWDRGLIVGKTSFGKGLVQSPIDFEDGSRLLLTTAYYYTPVGRLIQRDYKDKSFSDYYKEGHIDSLKNAALSKENRKKYITPGGRVVYGGGGITPDIPFERNIIDTLHVFTRKMINNLNVFFFSDFYAGNYRDKWQDKPVEHYIENFDVGITALNEFKKYLVNQNIEFSEEEFERAIPSLKRILKMKIAFQYWGTEGEIEVFLDEDKEFHQTKNMFDKAIEIQAIAKY